MQHLTGEVGQTQYMEQDSHFGDKVRSIVNQAQSFKDVRALRDC
jgi:hypothetical protein